MIRFLFRLLATIALAFAVVLSVIDATRSIAASAWTPTPLGDSWYAISPDSMNAARAFVEGLLPLLWDPVAVFLLELPGFVVFAVLALAFYAVGHRPEQRMRRLAPDT